MIKVNDNVIVESKEEFEKYLHPFDKDRFNGAILPSSFDLETTQFPLALECYPSYDLHFADSWGVLDLDEAKKKMIKTLTEEIDKRERILERIEEIS